MATCSSAASATSVASSAERSPCLSPCPPPPRAQYTLESESTEMQRETEDECEPFFVNLRTLPADQIRHLRNVGLLPPERPKDGKYGLVDDDAAAAASAAAAHNSSEVTLEDVTNGDGGGVRIEVLEEHTDDESGQEQANECANANMDEKDEFRVRLLRAKHSEYLTRALTRPLAPSYVSLDASRPWIIYWALHSLDMLDALPEETVMVNIVKTLEGCWEETLVDVNANEICNDPILKDIINDANVKRGQGKVQLPAGGFGGNVGQMAHCAPTYAAVLSLCIVYGAGVEGSVQSSKLALDLLCSRRHRLYAWYLSLRCELPLLVAAISSGSRTGERMTMTAYRMHHDGEVDVRATYTMLAVASLLQVDTPLLSSASAADFVASCQTYEGGFGGEPHSEAHGGYTFCAVAALKLFEKSMLASSSASDINNYDQCRKMDVDMDRLRGWVARRQMSYEGGFAGRCNKLVDGCYSFWLGGAMAVLDTWKDYDEEFGTGSSNLCFDRKFLQRYILLCAQDINGGLRDKPSKPRDFYHSCYNLSGLSVTQHVLSDSKDEDCADFDSNTIGETHPVLNVRVERVRTLQAVCF